MNEVWHVWAALGIALALYCLFFHYFDHPWLAAGCSVFVMADAGCLFAQPIVGQVVAVARLLSNHPGKLLGEWPPSFLQQWRIVDPALGLPFVLLQIVLLARARSAPTWPRLVLSGLAFGLLFYVYFHFWTAAALALAIAFLLDRKHQRIYAHSLWIGLILGAPLVVSNFLVKNMAAPDALARVSYFLPVPRLAFFLLPKAGLLLCVVAAAWIWKKDRLDTVYLLSLAVSGILLSNIHVITGLQFQSAHWRMIWGFAVEILFVIVAVDFTVNSRLWHSRKLRGACAVLACFYFLSSLYLVSEDTLHNKWAAETLAAYTRFITAARASSRLLVPGSVIAGDDVFCEFSTVAQGLRPLSGYPAEMSIWIDDTDWETRMALNSYLSGADSESFKTWAHDYSARYIWGLWSVGGQPRAVLEQALVHSFDEIQRNPATFIRRFDVRYVVLSKDRSVPAYLRESGWTQILSGPVWQLWLR